MSKISVKIYEMSYPSFSGFKVSVDNGNLFISTEHRVLKDHEIHSKYPEMTVEEFNRKIDSDLEFRKENPYNSGIVLKKISTIEEAYSSAADILKKDFKLNHLTKKITPIYSIVNAKNFYHDDSNPFSSIPSLALNRNIEYYEVDVTNESISKLQKNDYVTIQSKDNFLLEFPRRLVKPDSGEVYVNVKSIPVFKKNYLSIKELKELGFEIIEIQTFREKKKSPYDSRKYNRGELTLGLKPKAGTEASLLEARKSVKTIRDYYQSRIDSGDILLDQYMDDLYKESGNALKNIENILKVLDSLEEDSGSENENMEEV